jgi:hypothetical protein
VSRRISFVHRLATNHARLENYSPGVGQSWIEAFANALADGKLRPGLLPDDRPRYHVLKAAWEARGTV